MAEGLNLRGMQMNGPRRTKKVIIGGDVAIDRNTPELDREDSQAHAFFRKGSAAMSAELLENLAETAHEIFCEHLKKRGYKYGPETREEEKVHSSLRRYRDLPENEREQNRSNVRDIPNKLARVGCAMVPAKEKGVIGEFTEDEYKTMAMMEHRRWIQNMLASGWSYAEKTSKLKKRHNLLVPWDKLPPEEQEKDYVMVRGIPRILYKAGYTLLRSSD